MQRLHPPRPLPWANNIWVSVLPSENNPKAAVPKHCFERNTLTSLRYVAQDILMAAILYKGSTFIDVLAEANPLAAYVLWPM